MRGSQALPLVFLAVSSASGQLSQGERDRAISHLHATQKMFLDSIEGLNAAQWNFKPGDSTWSIAECSEHILLTEDRLYQLVTEKLLQSPESAQEQAVKDEQVYRMIADRSSKQKAPEVLQPTGRWRNPQELAAAFKQQRARTIQFIESTKHNLRRHFAPHPVAGPLDAYQWVLLAAAHTDRHTAQIAELKDHPQFPN